MKFSKFAAMAASLLLAVLAVPAAQASPIVVLDGPFATAVDNLNVDGTLYDVTFDLNTIGTTFQGNAAGALDAANGLDAALNASAAVNVEGSLFTANGFTIADDSVGDGPTVGDPLGTVGTWQVNIFSPGRPYAEFAAVPEPTTLALFAGGLLALGAAWRRSRPAKNTAA